MIDFILKFLLASYLPRSNFDWKHLPSHLFYTCRLQWMLTNRRRVVSERKLLKRKWRRLNKLGQLHTPSFESPLWPIEMISFHPTHVHLKHEGKIKRVNIISCNILLPWLLIMPKGISVAANKGLIPSREPSFANVPYVMMIRERAEKDKYANTYVHNVLEKGAM